MGDAIQFCRFAALLAERGFDVTLLVKPHFVRLFSSLAGVRIATSAAELAGDDRPVRWAPLMSVPGLLGVRPTNVPGRVPYLAVDAEPTNAWARRLGSHGFKVGICWKAGPQGERLSRSRDVPLADWAPLADIPEVRLITLQLGPGTDEIERVAFRDRIERTDD